MSEKVLTLVITFPIILVSMSIHELMHALASDKLGDDTARSMGRISLNPLKHIDPILTIALPLLLALSGGCIPWPPLDGSRVLYAFAPRPLQELMESIEKMGIAGLVIFMLLFYQLIAPFTNTLIEKLTNGLTSGLL
jgi:Zn-dependent protease